MPGATIYLSNFNLLIKYYIKKYVIILSYPSKRKEFQIIKSGECNSRFYESDENSRILPEKKIMCLLE